jgi:hypothetical protein
MMIELLVDRIEGTRHIREVHDPTFLPGERAGHVDLDAERMAVQTPALVVFGKIRQAMCRLDGELLEDFHNLLREMRVVALLHHAAAL